MGRSVIVIGCLGRRDILRIFDAVVGEFEFHFIEYRHLGYELSQSTYDGYGTLHCWDEFESAQAVLRQLRPELIVYLAHSSLTEIALRCAAGEAGVRAIHLEHGFRFRAEHDERVGSTTQSRRTLSWLRWWLAGKVGASLMNYSFVLRSAVRLAEPRRRRLAQYVIAVQNRARMSRTPRDFADIRRLDHYIAFSPETFAFHQNVDRVSDVSSLRTYVGMPQFDGFRIHDGARREADAVVLIDHPNATIRRFGWTPEYANQWARQIKFLCAELRLRLYVKTHPLDTNDTWGPLLEPGVLEVFEWSQVNDMLARASVALGFCSTLLLPFLAQPGIASFTFEMHPQPTEVPLSQPFLDAGVAAAASTISELRTLLLRRDEHRRSQEHNRAEFARQFLYALDGGAGARLRESLIAQRAASVSGGARP